MSVGPQSVHIVSTSFDYVDEDPDHDRIGHIFRDEGYSASKIYLLHNENVKGADARVEETAKREIEHVLDEHTNAVGNRGIDPVPTDFYSFEESFLTTYELIYREQRRDNRVFVNLSGGTKPLAIGMAFACALTGVEQPPFYLAKEYTQTEEGLDDTGLGPSVDVSQLGVFEFDGIVPDDDIAQRLLRFLLDAERDAVEVAQLLMDNDVIASKRESDDTDARRSTINKYHHRARAHLEPDGLVVRDDEVSLTRHGELVARILEVRTRVDEELDA